MKKKIAIALVILIGIYAFVNNTRAAFASNGGFEITYLNNPINGPIFEITNMLPGDCFERTIVAKNNGEKPIGLKVKTQNVIDNNNLSTQMSFEIKSGADTYFDSTLNNFFGTETTLGDLNKNQQKTYTFTACFKENAGNEFQNTSVKFDLIFATKFGHTPPHSDLPEECKALHISKFIIGDDNNNHLKGTSHSDYISGGEGNDHIEGGSADDCLVGGSGNDKIEGGSGNDIILGGEGNDDLRGGSGKDYLDGGPGNDTIFGGSGTDKCIGENKHQCEL